MTDVGDPEKREGTPQSWISQAQQVNVGTALPSTLPFDGLRVVSKVEPLRTVSLSNRVAVRIRVRTGTSPVPTHNVGLQTKKDGQTQGSAPTFENKKQKREGINPSPTKKISKKGFLFLKESLFKYPQISSY